MRNLLLVVIITLFAGACTKSTDPSAESQTAAKHEGWVSLIDTDLSKWDTYLSYRFKPGYDGSKPDEAPIGFNQTEAKDVFQTQSLDDDLLIRVTGEVYGALITKEDYRNYHLKLKVKWGDLKWDPRKNLLRDSGILYHSVGPHGAEYWRSWMQSQEMQIMEGHMGDFWSQATSAMDIRAFTPEYIMNPVASLDRPFLSVGYEQDIKGFVLRRENRESNFDEWTTLELICFEGKSLHIVNGDVVMVLKNSRYKKDGEFIPLNEGKIQLQSEASEVFFKDIMIKPLDALPLNYVPLFE